MKNYGRRKNSFGWGVSGGTRIQAIKATSPGKEELLMMMMVQIYSILYPNDDGAGRTSDVMNGDSSLSSDHSVHYPNVDGHGDTPSNEPPYLQHLHHELRDELWDVVKKAAGSTLRQRQSAILLPTLQRRPFLLFQ